MGSQRTNNQARNNIIREMVETERKYVRDLEVMQNYATVFSNSALLPRPTIYLIFSNLTEILAFQRKFLLGLEVIHALPWQEQRWGRHFLEAEEEFRVYKPYCVNYSKNNLEDLRQNNGPHIGFNRISNPPFSNRILQMREILKTLNHLINLDCELLALMAKPVSRMYKYPLLISSLLKACSPDNYQHYDELKSGLAAMERAVERANDAQCKVENVQIVEDLCRPRTQTAPLRLKGHILLARVMQTEAVAPDLALPPVQRDYPLDIWWAGEHGLEVLTLRMEYESHRNRWNAQIRRLISECAKQRALEHGFRRRSRPIDQGDSGFDSDDGDEPLHV
ncbi:Rho guanine nucleotide exchange factor scd1 [Mycena venus]|uniref:Rho guanine nucleotide exchange factor scd1 n=1 Tax=Mycena venus TaxID=2733690 RepID=A0A8H6WUL1_9AGAR|nr:Rho guanine nucleotide exchange factor scd1 [Mycena venus]